MKLLLSSFLLLTIIISALPSLEARPKGSKTCPNVDGAPLVLCAANFKNYCAYFTGGECGNKVCARQTLNDCTACLDPAVLYYFKKPCTANKVYCDANGRPQSCSRKRNLVCGYYTQDCPHEICSRTLLNPCSACKDPVIKYFTKGRCRNPTDTTCLRDGNLKRCGSSSPPVCGFYTIGCPFGFCQQDYQNQCEACRDSKVIFTRPGYCQELSASCDLVDIPSVCPEVYSPVCASLRDCQGEGCTRTFDNVCFACSAGGYALFKSGICEQDRVNCDYRSDTCDAIYDPVCAFFDEPCVDGLCFATAENGCRACADNAVDYYIDGACKPASDNRVYCLPNSRPEGCPDNVDPVCAFRNIVCITTPCPNTETIFNGCTACQDPSVQYYTPGECPDDGDA